MTRQRMPLDDFASFYREHAEKLLVFFVRRTYDSDVALDLVGETFAEAFGSRKRFRGTTQADAAAWLYAIARHQLSRYVRKGRAERRALMRLGVEIPVLEDADYERIVDLAGLREVRELVTTELAGLPPRHREAVVLRVVDELPYDEVARRLEISEQAARARVSRGLKAIAAAMEEPRPASERA